MLADAAWSSRGEMRLLGWGRLFTQLIAETYLFFCLVNFPIAFYGVNAFCNHCTISPLLLSAVHSSSSCFLRWRLLAWDLQVLLGGNTRWKPEKKLSQYLRGKYSSAGCWHMCIVTKKAASHGQPQAGLEGVKTEQNTTHPCSWLWQWLQKEVLFPDVAPLPACPDQPFGTTE